MTAQKAIPIDNVACFLTEARFQFRDLPEAQAVASFLANACPNPRLAIVGISEIFMNAIEHGNLGITFDEKTKLQKDNLWLMEIERRLQLPENLNKFVEVIVHRNKAEIRIRVKDQGPGFDWKKFTNNDNNEKSLETHGRGIPIAKNVAFTRLEYFGNGNEVEGIIPLK